MMQALALQPSHAHFWVSEYVGAFFHSNVTVCCWRGLRRQKVLCFTKNKCVHHLCVFDIQMLEFSFGVACGAKQFWHFTPKMIVSRYVCFWVARRGQKLKIFSPKTLSSLKMTNQCPSQAEHLEKQTLFGATRVILGIIPKT